MAILDKKSLLITGPLGKYSIYKRRDMDKIIVRSKGGPERDDILKSDNFIRTRELNKEWSGCAMAGKYIRRAIHPLRHLADYNISGPLNAIMKVIQKCDGFHKPGERDISISSKRALLEGFSLNKLNYWESVVKSPLHYSILRSSGKAFIEIPALIPGINFGNKQNRSLFRFIGVLGIIADVQYSADHNRYESLSSYVYGGYCSYKNTSWYSAFKPAEKLTLELEIPADENLQETDTMLLAIGIEFGNPITNDLVEPVKYSGSAKILITG